MPSNDDAKKPIDLVPALRAGARALTASIPVVGRIVKAVVEAEEDTRARRLALWSASLANDEESEDAFADRLSAALGGDQGELVRAAILESTRAVIDAIDESVVPGIGRLTKRFLTTRTPELHIYRGLLGMLKAMDTEMCTAFGDAVRIIIDHTSSAGFGTVVEIADAEGSWRWYMDGEVTLATGPVALRLVSALVGRGVLVAWNHMPDGPRFPPSLVDVLMTIFDMRS